MYHKKETVSTISDLTYVSRLVGGGGETLTVADVEIEGGWIFQSDVSKNSYSDFLYTIKIMILRFL